MRYYEQDDNRKGKRCGLAAAACYLVVLFVLFVFVSFRTVYTPITTEGLIVEFGSTSEGESIDFGSSADGGSGTREVSAAQTREPDRVRTQPQREIATQTHEEAPAVKEQAVQGPAETVVEPEKVEQPQVNPRGLFPGAGATDSQSQGSGSAQGNRGHEGGEGSTAGSGLGGSGTGSGAAGDGSGGGAEINLPDRRIAGRLPLPRYDEDIEGRIVVDITVDASGNVVRASVNMQGTTILNETLQSEAVEAARKSKFSAAGPTEQFGSITYVFKLK